MRPMLMTGLCSLMALLLGLVACMQRPKTVEVEPPVEKPAFTLCDREGECTNGAQCVEGLCTTYYFQDDTDTSHDIFNPGCHWAYTDSACTQNRQLFKPDTCEGRAKPQIYMIEWELQQCHPQTGDADWINCDKECKLRGAGMGICVMVPDVCAGHASAKCVCDPPTP